VELGLIVSGSRTADQWMRRYTIRRSSGHKVEAGIESSFHPDALVGHYVALSLRAPRLLFLGTTTSYRVFYPAESLFLQEGQWCTHPRFGAGRILGFETLGNERFVMILFGDVERRLPLHHLWLSLHDQVRISVHIGHPFRLISDTCFGASRTPVSRDVGHLSGGGALDN
jgi:hypothetical protein